MIPLLKSFRKYLQVGNIKERRYKQIKFFIRSSIFEANGTNIFINYLDFMKGFASIQGALTKRILPPNTSHVEKSGRRRLSSAPTLLRLSTRLGAPYKQGPEKYLLLEKVPSPRPKAENKPELLQRGDIRLPPADQQNWNNSVFLITLLVLTARNHTQLVEKHTNSSSKLACLYHQQILVFPKTRAATDSSREAAHNSAGLLQLQTLACSCKRGCFNNYPNYSQNTALDNLFTL